MPTHAPICQLQPPHQHPTGNFDDTSLYYSLLPDDQLRQVVEESAWLGDYYRARFIVGLAYFDSRNLADATGHPNAYSYIQAHLDVSSRTAAEYLNVARFLKTFTPIADAYLKGQVSYSSVRLLRGYVTEDNLDELLDLATTHTHAELAELLAGRNRAGKKKPPGPFLDLDFDNRNGDLTINGRIPAAQATPLIAAMKIMELLLYNATTNDESQGTITAEEVDGIMTTLADLDNPLDILSNDRGITPPAESSATTGTTNDDDEDPTNDLEGRASRFGTVQSGRWLTCLIGMATAVISHRQAAVRAPGANIHVVMGPDGRINSNLAPCAESRELIDTVINGKLKIYATDETGIPLKKWRETRLVTDAQATALIAALGGRCFVPGCASQRFLEFHHIHNWADGGYTNPENLLPLCSGHHAMITAGTLTVHVDEDDPALLRFRYPNGASYTSIKRAQPVADNLLRLDLRDKWTHGPVPVGCVRGLTPIYDIDNFDDDDHEPDTSTGTGTDHSTETKGYRGKRSPIIEHIMNYTPPTPSGTDTDTDTDTGVASRSSVDIVEEPFRILNAGVDSIVEDRVLDAFFGDDEPPTPAEAI